MYFVHFSPLGGDEKAFCEAQRKYNAHYVQSTVICHCDLFCCEIKGKRDDILFQGGTEMTA